MKIIKGLLKYIWIFEAKEEKYFVMQPVVGGFRSAHVGEEVNIFSFRNKTEAVNYLRDGVSKMDRRNCFLLKKEKLEEANP